MLYWVIGDEETVAGFGYAGVKGTVVSEEDEAREALDKVSHRAEIGIIILSEALADGLREDINEIRRRESGPVVVEVPGSEGRLPDRKRLIDMIQEAMGIRL